MTVYQLLAEATFSKSELELQLCWMAKGRLAIASEQLYIWNYRKDTLEIVPDTSGEELWIPRCFGTGQLLPFYPGHSRSGRSLWLYDLSTQKRQHLWALPAREDVYDLTVVPEQDFVAVEAENLRLYRLSTGKLLFEHQAPLQPFEDTHFEAEGKVRTKLGLRPDELEQIVPFPKGGKVLLVNERTIEVLNLSGEVILRRERAPKTHYYLNQEGHLDSFPAGPKPFLRSIPGDSLMPQYNVQEGEQHLLWVFSPEGELSFDQHLRTIEQMSLNAEGTLATFQRGGILRIFCLRKRNLVWQHALGNYRAEVLQWHPTEQLLAVGSAGKVQLFLGE